MILILLLTTFHLIFFYFSILFFLIYDVYLTNNIFFTFPLIGINILDKFKCFLKVFYGIIFVFGIFLFFYLLKVFFRRT
jgi:hypothetical protein